MRRPRLRADYLPVPLSDVDGGGVLLLGETRTLWVDDPVAADLVGALDGRTQVAELAGRYPAAALGRALRRLGGLGVLADGPAAAEPAVAAGWDGRGVDPDRAQAWSESGSVLLVAAGAPAAGALARSVAALGPRVRPVPVPDVRAALAAEPGAVVVAAPASMADPRLAAVNAACLAAGRSWTLVRPHGQVLLLGPHLVPGETGCWECLRQRWVDNHPVPAFAAGRGTPADPARAVSAAATAALAGLLAAELPVLALRGRSERITGRMVALDTRDLSTETHRLTRLPQCPACGDPDLTGKAPPRVDLTDRPRAGVAETLARLEPAVSRYLGVVTRLAPLGEAALTHTYRAGHHFPPARRVRALRESLRGHSGGKGRTDAEARLGAIAEAIERHCGVWRAGSCAARPTHRASYAQLGPDRAVRLPDLLGFSARQYADRAAHDAGTFHRVPAPVPDDRPLDWTTGWSLTGDRPREIPAAYCWYGHPDEACAADSNGCAAGGTLAEAVLRGFCELVERDSVALWWQHRSRLPGVYLDSFTDPWLHAVRDCHAGELGRELWALDLTADLGIPAYAAVSRRTVGPEDVLVGFGADLDATAALGRAVAEVNQFLPLVAGAGAAAERYPGANTDARRWFATVTVAGQPWLAPDPAQPPSTVDTHPAAPAAGAVAYCVEVARAAGLEVIVVDQSRPDVELPVARVIVPGLRHFWRRLGAGRLWTVPAALGRSPTAAGEDEVNPLNVFF